MVPSIKPPIEKENPQVALLFPCKTPAETALHSSPESTVSPKISNFAGVQPLLNTSAFFG